MPPNIQAGRLRTAGGRPDPSKYTDAKLKRIYRSVYPEGLDLTPGSKLHERIVNEIMDRAQASERVLSGRHATWDTIDHTLTAYMPVDEIDRAVKDRDEKKPIHIVVPESYASLETFGTYMMSVFGDYPVCRIEGTGPEDVIGGILLEKVINIQAQRSALLLEEMAQWRDGFAYGFGALSPAWSVIHGKRSVAEPIIEVDPFTGIPSIIGYNRTRIDTIQYEGLQAETLDPRYYLPDPNVPLYKVQKGEYVGWVSHDNYYSLLKEESKIGSAFFNVQYLRRTAWTRSSIYGSTVTARESQGGEDFRADRDTDVTFPVDVIWMYVEIIPNDWDLGPNEQPEKWLFGVASDSIVIGAAPADLDHGQFPVVVCAPDADGHCHSPTARMEILSGYQTFLNYLVNTHMIETDKFLKNRFVVNPKWVYVRDIKQGKSIIRTRPSAWAREVKGTFEQVQMSDVTRNHMADANQIIQLSRQHGGSVDALLGIQRQSGERVTATEYEGTRGSAISRLQRLARIISMQSRIPMFTQACYNTQQFMSQETYVSVIGETEQVLRETYGLGPEENTIRVSPFEINLNSDVIIQDSSLSGGESADAWIQWRQVAAQNPITAQQIDWLRVDLHIARLMGNKAPERFMINRTPVTRHVVPDEVALEEQRRGNIIGLNRATQPA